MQLKISRVGIVGNVGDAAIVKMYKYDHSNFEV
jgi:hypothetical protein